MAVQAGPMDVAALSRVPVYLPRDGTSQVTAAWRCGGTPVFLVHDVQLSFEDGWQNVKIPAKLEDLARDYGGSVATIQGLAAWVVAGPASNDEVLIVKEGTAIKLSARSDVPIDVLVALADTLDLSRPVGR